MPAGFDGEVGVLARRAGKGPEGASFERPRAPVDFPEAADMIPRLLGGLDAWRAAHLPTEQPK